jgi:hypothetical protein
MDKLWLYRCRTFHLYLALHATAAACLKSYRNVDLHEHDEVQERRSA